MDNLDTHFLIRKKKEALEKNSGLLSLALLFFNGESEIVRRHFDIQFELYGELRVLLISLEGHESEKIEKFDRLLYEFKLNYLLSRENVRMLSS